MWIIGNSEKHFSISTQTGKGSGAARAHTNSTALSLWFLDPNLLFRISFSLGNVSPDRNASHSPCSRQPDGTIPHNDIHSVYSVNESWTEQKHTYRANGTTNLYKFISAQAHACCFRSFYQFATFNLTNPMWFPFLHNFLLFFSSFFLSSASALQPFIPFSFATTRCLSGYRSE